MRLERGIVLRLELEPPEHGELAFLRPSRRLLIRSLAGKRRSQALGAEGLEFDGIGPAIGSNIDQLVRKPHIAVVIDASLRNDEAGRIAPNRVVANLNRHRDGSNTVKPQCFAASSASIRSISSSTSMARNESISTIRNGATYNVFSRRRTSVRTA